jgi:hypothetical protein
MFVLRAEIVTIFEPKGGYKQFQKNPYRLLPERCLTLVFPNQNECWKLSMVIIDEL